METDNRILINDLLFRLRDGDRSAFDACFAALWPPILNLAKKGLKDFSEAEDVAQETVAKVFAQVQDFDPNRDGLAWALTIAKFEILTSRKKRSRRQENLSDEGMAFKISTERNVEERIEISQMNDALNQIFDGLPEADRETLKIYLEDSQEAKSPLLRKRFERAVQRVRRAWKETYG